MQSNAFRLALCIFVQAAATAPAAATAASSAPSASHFDAFEIRVLGNTVLPATEVERAVYPFLGAGKSVEDMEAARTALESAYHTRGFGTVFVDLPEQEINEGVVRLKVTEGRLHEVRISGARYFSERHIRALTPAATNGTVPSIPRLQQQLAAVNSETRDRTVVPILKAGPVPGTVDLALKVEDHLPLHAGVEVNNQYTPNTAPLRALMSLSYDNLFGRLDSLSLQYQNAPQRGGQLGVFAASYATRISAGGTRLAFLFINSSSDVATVGAINVLGKGKVFGTRVVVPIDGVPNANQSLTMGMDYKRFRESIKIDPTTAIVTPISYVNFSVAYAGNWLSEAREWTFNSAANFGLRGLVNDAKEFADKRFQGRSNYFYVRSDGSVNTRLPQGFHLIVRLAGQFAEQALISNEHFSAAGADGVRGYLEAEELGDVGIKGTIQLGSPPLQLGTWFHADGFAFLDEGKLNFLNVLPGQASTATLRSWGLGVNVLTGKDVSSSVTWAYPLLDANDTKKGKSRVLFSVRGSF